MKSQTILVYSLPRHDAEFTSTPWQLAEQFSKTNRVFFADNPFTFLELFTRFRSKAVQQRLKAYLSRPCFGKSGVMVIHMPFILPINFLPQGKLYNGLSAFNTWLVAKRINRCLKSFRVNDLVYINSFNFYFPQLQRKIKSTITKTVYHCIDPIIKSYSKKHGIRLQNEAAASADLIVCTAEALMDQFNDQKFPKCHFIGNGANYDLFADAKPNDATRFRKSKEEKIMGYVGNIERRLDYDLLLKVLKQLPNWRLVLAGPVDKTFIPKEFFNHSQITFVGAVPHHQVPEIVHSFDVALIPFKCDEVSAGIYPLKLYEYLATGQPVVCTNFNPSVLAGLKFLNLIEVSTDAFEFARHVREAARNKSTLGVSMRKMAAKEVSWEKRATQFIKLLA